MNTTIILPLITTSQPSLIQSVLTSPVSGAIAGFALGFISSYYAENRRRRFELKRDAYLELLQVINEGNIWIRKMPANGESEKFESRFEIAKLRVKIFGSNEIKMKIDNWKYFAAFSSEYETCKQELVSRIEKEIFRNGWWIFQW